jgi:hypothetical protein
MRKKIMKMLLKRIFILLLVGSMILLPLISCDNADEKESGEPSESVGRGKRKSVTDIFAEIFAKT